VQGIQAPSHRRYFSSSKTRRFGAEEENADTGIQRLIVKRFGEGLASGEFDGVISTNTFEHISPDEIPKVLSECHRVLKPRGVLSLRIDYVDHYSYFDRRVSPYNFLHYSDAAWKIFNPPDHYQNRLRHSDYVGMLEKAGFVVVEQATTPITSTELAWLRSVPLHKRFRGYAEDDLAVLGSFIVARPSPRSSRDRQH
jgi:SAM-dependent methyltransferase